MFFFLPCGALSSYNYVRAVSDPERVTFAKKDESHLRKLSRTLRELVENVRFSIPDKILPEDPATQAANEKFDTLEKLQRFRPSQFEAPNSPASGNDGAMYEFVVSNVDVDVAGLKFCPRDEDDKCVLFPAGIDYFVVAKRGEAYTVKDGNGTILKSLTVQSGQEQIVITQAYIDLK